MMTKIFEKFQRALSTRRIDNFIFVQLLI